MIVGYYLCPGHDRTQGIKRLAFEDIDSHDLQPNHPPMLQASRQGNPPFSGAHRGKTNDSHCVAATSGGRFQVRFLDGEEREVTKVREPPVPIYMLPGFSYSRVMMGGW